MHDDGLSISHGCTFRCRNMCAKVIQYEMFYLIHSGPWHWTMDMHTISMHSRTCPLSRRNIGKTTTATAIRTKYVYSITSCYESRKIIYRHFHVSPRRHPSTLISLRVFYFIGDVVDATLHSTFMTSFPSSL